VVKITVAIPQGRDLRASSDYFDVLIFLEDQMVPTGKIRKGRWFLIEGKMKQRRWEVPEGQSRTKVENIADSVEHHGTSHVRQAGEPWARITE
jgi:single-stranded DNA-binding protein